MSRSNAALVNGVMVSCLEADHSGHSAHPAGSVLPAALATGEHFSANGKDSILAIALGYEVVCRIGDAQTRAVEDERGFHNPGANGPFGAAAAVGKLLGLDAETQSSAFGLAASRSAGLIEYVWDGSMTKRLHLGFASQGGLDSAFLAERGIRGPKTVLEGRYGYLHAFSPSPKVEMLLADIGSDWRLLQTRIKAYPCHGTSQALVASIQELKAQYRIDPGTVRRIHIAASTQRMIQQRWLNASPATHLQAQLSIPYTVAVALHRDLDDPLQYDESVLVDENIRRIAELVTWEETPPNEDPMAAVIEVTTNDSVHRIEAGPYRGSLQNPADLDDVEGKFRRYSRNLISPSRQDDISQIVRNLEDLDDISALAALIRN
jgi:2-methylcitrate dehydratase PrpD